MDPDQIEARSGSPVLSKKKNTRVNLSLNFKLQFVTDGIFFAIP